MMTREQEIIWLAGILEGEGCFRILTDKHNINTRAKLRVELTMTDKDVVEHAASIFPGTVRLRTPHEQYKQAYRVSWCSAKAEEVMRAVLPYMGERRSAKISACLTTPNLSHHPKDQVS